MRALVFLLILANLVFFVWSKGYFGAAPDADAFRIAQQLLPERVRVVSRDAPPLEKVGIAYRQSDKKIEEVCVRLPDLQAAEAASVEALIAERLPVYRVLRTLASGSASYWVFIPPTATRAEVDRKVGELKKLGVPELFVVQDAGVDQFAISLGIFSTPDAANERLEQLRAKGVRSAQVGERAGKAATATLELRGPRSDALTQAIREALPDIRPLACAPPLIVAQ